MFWLFFGLWPINAIEKADTMAASAELGSFGVRAGLSSNSSSQVKNMVCKVFGDEDYPLSEERVSVMEMRCPDEGCPDLETIVMIFDQHDEDFKIKLKIKKPVSEVAESDVKDMWARHQASQSGDVQGPCGCCEQSIEKQQMGCPCCGFQIQQSTETMNPQLEVAQEQPSETVDFTVTALVGGHTWKLQVDCSATIDEVKSAIQQLEHGPVHSCQRLLFRGRQLDNNKSIVDCGIEDGVNIVLVRDQKQ